MPGKLFLALLVVFIYAGSSANASEEGVLSLGFFRVESPGIGESGPVVVSGRQSQNGFESLRLEVFGKLFALSHEHLKSLQGGHINGLQLSYEDGYPELGGRTVYLLLSIGFTSEATQKNLVTITASGTITITQETLH